MTDDEIEQFILDTIADRERKIAFVVGTIAKLGENRDDPEIMRRVASAIKRLIARNILVATGDVSHWRNSEVKRAASS